MNSYEQATQEVRDAFKALCKGRVEAAVKAEREACAKLADDVEYCGACESDVAKAIRARSNT